MTTCIFCKIINGEIKTNLLYQDELMVVFADCNPKAKIHLLALPKLHIKSLAELTTDNSHIITHMLMQLPKIAQTQGLANGFRTIINTGKGGGQEIEHLHIHLLGGKKLPGF